MAFRLLCSDIDDTLLKPNSRLTKETKEAAEYVLDKDVYVTLATGRSFNSAKKIAKSLRLPAPFLISHDGAFVASDVREPVFERRLGAETVYKITDILENYHCHFRLYHEKYVIANKTKQKKDIVSRVQMHLPDPFFYPVHYADSPSHRLIDQPLSVLNIKAMFWSQREQSDACEELKETVDGLRLISHENGMVHLTHKDASKGKALQFLGARLGIRPEEMVAAGYDERDLDMIRLAGLGVAVGDASDNVKREADWITRSSKQNGIPYMVREVFRKQLRAEI